MANFAPLNNYTLYILDKIIAKYQLKSPFLDGGCGTGYVSRHLAMKGWEGKAIDLSEDAVRVSRENLSSFDKVKVAKEGILNQKGKYNTVILFDVIEHIKDDKKVLRKISQLLNLRGHVLLALTSNPKEWRWDDEFYGHYRRYSESDIRNKLMKVGLEPKDIIEYTFPAFWLIRRLYTGIQKPPHVNFKDKVKRTEMSAISSSWHIPYLFQLIIRLDFLWRIIFFFQYHFFKNNISSGFAMLVLAQKLPKNA